MMLLYKLVVQAFFRRVKASTMWIARNVRLTCACLLSPEKHEKVKPVLEAIQLYSQDMKFIMHMYVKKNQLILVRVL